MTKEAYWAVFLKTNAPSNIEDLWLLDEMKSADFYIQQTEKYKPRLVFSTGLNSDDYNGPEAMVLRREGKPAVVWN